MNYDEYQQQMFETETTYWWYAGRRIIIAETIRRYLALPATQALDIGCGTGGNFTMLSSFSKTCVGIDTSPRALEYCRTRGWDAVELIREDGVLRFADETIGIITMLDVLEHIADERPLLREVSRILQPDGLLIVTVPAFQFLWSEHDVAAHHYRRYTRKNIMQLLTDQGFEIISASYIITFLFPLIVFYRALKGFLNFFHPTTPTTSHVPLPNILNAFLTRILAWESKLLTHFSLPFGTSILIVATKRKT